MENTKSNNGNTVNNILSNVDRYTFSNIDYYLISNSICFNAITKYLSTFNADYIPASFVQFYIEEMQRYNMFMSTKLKSFFHQYKSEDFGIKKSITVFSKTFSNFCKIKIVPKYSFIVGLKPDIYLIVNRHALKYNIKYDDNNSKEVISALNDVINISTRIKENNEVRDISIRYTEFLKSYKLPNMSETGTERKQQSEKLTAISEYVPQKQKKVVQLRIPKLTLPYTYPKSSSISRVDTLYFTTKFTSSTKLIEFLNNNQINGVSFTKQFVDKRLSLYDLSKKSKFSDFF